MASDDSEEADWTPDGKSLTLISGEDRIEGKLEYGETSLDIEGLEIACTK